jgi:uncharacterized repeat protein (TIGR01451 family)
MNGKKLYLSLAPTLGSLAVVGVLVLLAISSNQTTITHAEGLSPSNGPILGLQIIPSDYFPGQGDVLTYTIVMSNTGDALASGAVMINALPAGLDYVSSTLQATGGAVAYLDAGRAVRWEGDLAVNDPITLAYAATLNTDDYIYNTAVVTHPLAAKPAGATSSPAQAWTSSEVVDAPHRFEADLGSGRHIVVDGNGALHVAYAGANLYYATFSGTDWLSETAPGTVSGLSNATLALDDQGQASIVFYGEDRLWLAQQITVAGDLASGAVQVTTWTVAAITEIGEDWKLGPLDLQRGSDGRIHLVYEYDEALYYTAYDGAVWLTPTLIIPGNACSLGRSSNSGFSLALDPDGLPHVACVQDEGAPYQVRFYTYSASAPWTDYEVVASGDKHYAYPSLAYDGKTPHVSFFRVNTALYHAQRNGSWQATLIEDVGGTWMQRSTALDIHAGRVGVAYALHDAGDDAATLRFASWPLTGATWTTETVATVADVPSYWDAPYPTLALDSSGQAHLAYYADDTLRHAAETASFTIQAIDESRTIEQPAIAVGSDASIHVAYLARGLYYATHPAGSAAWTKALAIPDVDPDWLDLALDAANDPHIAYAVYQQPLYHAILSSTDWITRLVDAPGDVPAHPAIGAEMTGTAHIAYMAQEGENYVVRHAAFDGASWTTETLAVAGPAALWSHEQQPQLVAQEGKVYVLYADCTAYQDSGDYPIHLMLAAWDGSAWSAQAIHDFAGRCNLGLQYQLSGDEEGRLGAVVSTADETVAFWLQDASEGGAATAVLRRLLSGSPPTSARAAPSMIITTMPRYRIRGNGWQHVYTKQSNKMAQFLDKEGNPSQPIQVGEIDANAYLADVGYRGDTAAAAELSAKGNALWVQNTPPPPPPVECCLEVEVSPPEAANAGCTAGPIHTQGECSSEVDVFAKEAQAAGWNFWQWGGVASGEEKETTAIMNGQVPDCSVATAIFVQPVLSLSGGSGPQYVCPGGTSEQTVIVLRFTLSVNAVAQWRVHSVTFLGSGAHEQADVELVALHVDGQVITGAYPGPDTFFTLDVDRLISAGDSIDLDLVYQFKAGMTCPRPVETFSVETNVDWVAAIPESPPYLNYAKRQPTPVTGGPMTMAFVRNVGTEEAFGSIQEAINDSDTHNMHTIMVCPGTCTENVDVTKSLNIQSTDGFEVTTVQAANANDHVFHVMADSTTIQGFSIKGATGEGKAGIYGDDVHSCALVDNRVEQNENGIHLDRAMFCQIYGSDILNNEKNGILFFTSNDNSIIGNRLVGNCRGIDLLQSSNNVVHGNTIKSNTCATGIHLNGSNGDIAGNTISDDAGDGIHCENGAAPEIYKNKITGNQGDGIVSESSSTPVIHHNNVAANTGYGVRNLDPSVTLQAHENWWGDSSGPGGSGPGVGDEVGDQVDFGSWLTEAVHVAVLAEQDVLLVPIGQEDGNEVYLQSFVPDTLTVVVTDTLGWLVGPTTFTVTLEGELGNSAVVSVSVPADTPHGTVDEVYVTAASQSDPGVTDWDMFQVKAVTLCAALNEAGINGPVSGYTGTLYAFTSVITPADATEPVTYTWSPEPESGQRTASAEYLWVAPGVHTITLTAENCGGMISDTHAITIEAPPPGCPRPLEYVSINGSVSGYTDTLYAFTSVITPADATEPVTYTWSPEPENGQRTASAEYLWVAPGVHAITLTAENCGGVVSDTHTITIKAPPPGCPHPLERVGINGSASGYTGTLYAFTAVITPADATEPVTYTWSPEPENGQRTAKAEYLWAAPGVHTITLTAENCGRVVSDTHTITIKAPPPGCPHPLEHVGINGSASGYTGTLYAFTSVITPANATEPVTYTWSPEPESGQRTANAGYLWAAPGVHTITLTAENCGGMVSDTHTITIEAPPEENYAVYLPLIVRSTE